MSDQDLLDARIREHYQSIPPSEKPLADLLLSFPGNITDYSATELCELADTSRAAATRFFSRLGYKDFNDARRQAREAKQWGAPIYQSGNFDNSQNKQTNTSEIITNHINSEQANLQRTLEGIDISRLRSLVKAISNKKRIMVVGYRNNRFLAEYLHRQLGLLRANVTLHPGANQAIAEELFDINEDDLLIVFAMRRRTPILDDIIELACNKKAPVALISDPTAAILEKRATWKLNCIVHGTSKLDSYTSVMSVLTLLISFMFSENPAVLDRLRAIESAHEQLGELGGK
ncbi:MurR/RpiR family transcriptional regulator [Psychromonas sp.]|nr:MurR/RpiR family transcriptional regulator [Psychromonas sp.]